MGLCAYYQAIVDRERCWMFTALLRSYEHLVFDRTLDARESRFEFFVPPGNEDRFEAIMHNLAEHGLVRGLVKLPNRFAQDPEGFARR